MELLITLLVMMVFIGFALVGLACLVMLVESLFRKVRCLIQTRIQERWLKRWLRSSDGFIIEDEYPPRSAG